MRAAGEERYFRQEFDSASAIWRVELTRALEKNDSVAEARVRMWLGLAAYRLGDYSTARSEGERSLALKRRVGLDDELSRSFNGLGLLAWNEGRYRDALASFDSAVASAKRHDDKEGIARAAGNIPLVRVELGDFDGARRGFNEAIVLAQKIRNDRAYANALNNLAMLEIRLGNSSKALPLISRARGIYARINYMPGEANALGQLATALSAIGDLQGAITATDSSLRISRAEGLQQETASNLEVLADLQAEAGNLRLALQSLHEADSLDKELGLVSERGTNLRRTSIILLTLEETPAAVARARDALAAHKKGDSRAEAVLDRTELAEALAKTGNVNAAQAQADSALREARSMNNPSSIREASAVAARISLNMRDPKRALAQLGSIRGTTPSDWRLFDLQSEALMEMGRLADAELAAKRSVALLDQERKTLAVGPLRSAYLANRVAPFARLIALHIRRGDTTSAFLVAASVPGRTFAERVNRRAGKRNQSSRDDKGESILRRIHAIETQIDSLGAESGTEQRESLSRALQSARAEYEGHLSMTGGAVQVAARSLSLAQVQSQLAPDQAAIVFVSGPERLDCFVVRRNQLHYWAAPISDGDLLQRVRVVRAAMEKPGRGISALNALGQLHDLLIAPAVSSSMLTGSTRLAMVLHGPLTALPTAALWNRKTRRFLIQDVELSYLPSVSALAPRDGSSFSARLAIFAPFPDSLPGSVIEARSIARLIPKSTIRIGASARERDVRAAITSGFSLHIASHGIHNVQNPLFSSVSVGRDRGNGSMDDGRLELHEIADLTTTSPLIFLSGCETAVGTSSDGRLTQQVEGGSLSEAFLAAGARLVIATLWRVDDRTAVRIAQLFYRQLQLGRTPQRALAIAQRDEINKASDFTWAAYQVSAQNPPTLP